MGRLLSLGGREEHASPPTHFSSWADNRQDRQHRHARTGIPLLALPRLPCPTIVGLHSFIKLLNITLVNITS